MAPETVASGSPDSTHIRAEGSANVTSIRMALPRSAWELGVAVILALSLLVNVMCIYEVRDIGTRKWLHDWDLNQFENGPFADLKTKVQTNQQLITAFGPQQCKR